LPPPRTRANKQDRGSARPLRVNHTFCGPPQGAEPMSDPRPPESAAQTPTDGREANGRWAKGNPGGPGNPFARRVATLRKVILDRLTEQDLLAITEALLAKAKEGSVGAAKLLLAYAIGKPASAPDPDRLDGQE